MTKLPRLNGINEYKQDMRIMHDVDMSRMSWSGAGGIAKLICIPSNMEALSYFIQNMVSDCRVIIVGAGSNMIFRDYGCDIPVIRLGRNFRDITYDNDTGLITAGGADQSIAVAQFAASLGRTGLEFLSCIPGTIGGGVCMNAGCFGVEYKDVVHSIEVMDYQGNYKVLNSADIEYIYRGSSIRNRYCVLSVSFISKSSTVKYVTGSMNILKKRKYEGQPTECKTCGSTFKNPYIATSGCMGRAWEYIAAAGCRGARVGDAKMSEKHCNFMINVGKATADDFETLGEHVRDSVYMHSGITLEWEIIFEGKRICKQ